MPSEKAAFPFIVIRTGLHPNRPERDCAAGFLPQADTNGRETGKTGVALPGKSRYNIMTVFDCF